MRVFNAGTVGGSRRLRHCRTASLWRSPEGRKDCPSLSRSPNDLPENAYNKVAGIEVLTGRPFNIISTSLERSDTLAISGPFTQADRPSGIPAAFGRVQSDPRRPAGTRLSPNHSGTCWLSFNLIL